MQQLISTSPTLYSLRTVKVYYSLLTSKCLEKNVFTCKKAEKYNAKTKMYTNIYEAGV